MTQTEKDITLRLAFLGLLTAVLIVWMMVSVSGTLPEGIRMSTIDIGETIQAYMR